MTQIPLVLAMANRAAAPKVKAVLERGGFRIIAQARNLMETFSAVEDHQPAAVLISESMTGFQEFEVMRGLFETLGIRWVALSDGSPSQPASLAPPARSGLFPLDIRKPAEDFLAGVRSLLRIEAAPAAPTAPAHTSLHRQTGGAGRLILLGGSTGGVDALVQLLSAFPVNCPPTFIVQHTGRGFGTSLARLLSKHCAARVIEAQEGAAITPGTICIGAGQEAHLTLARTTPFRARLEKGAPVAGHMPSVDMLFASAVPFAGRTVAALLTGMGRDGAQGLAALRSAGARTIAQDKATSVVYGMPRAAMELGAAEMQLPLPRIAETLLDLAQTPAETVP